LSTALKIIVLSAAFCLIILIPIAATDTNNADQYRISSNNTYTGFDNLGMSNIKVGEPFTTGDTFCGLFVFSFW
jgi:hypothetical protein